MANETARFARPSATAHPMDRMASIGLESNDDARLTPVVTLVVWVVCLIVGMLGLRLSYSRPPHAVKSVQSVKAERLVVELSKEPPAPGDAGNSPGNLAPITPLPADAMAPPPIAVAEPSPAIAFAVPVEGPTRVVPYNQATYAKPAKTATPAVQSLTFGQGEGRQPSPEYPATALEQHQEGTVVVRLVVGENGQVSSAEAIEPSRWPLLNDAAVRAVRHQWRFPPGSLRVYDVAIRFEIAPQ